MGDHLFRVKGVGQIPRDQHEVEIELAVYDPYSLDSFTASTNFVNEPPASVTLSWSATNLTSAQIVTDHGDVIAIDPAELAGGSIEVTPLVTTTYTFEAESFGRHLQSSVTVEVRSVKFDSVDASSSRVTFGASVSLNWGASATTPNAAVWIDGPNAPVVDFVEVFDSPFEDISVTGGARLSSDLEGDAYAYVAFPSGFAFPFSGALHTSARAAGTGMITFSPVVFARSDQPGFTPDYVYDSSLVMTVPEGDVGIYLDGVAVSKVSWSSSWTIPQGASLELLLREIAPGIATWTSESVYKVSQKPYDGMNKGTPGTGFVEDSEHYFVQASLDVPFIDIRSTGTRVTALETDTANSAIPVSFSIPFFDDVVTEVYASTNGWIRFGSSSASGHYAPGSLPRSTSASPVAPLFAVYWDDWGCSQSPNPMQFHYEEKVIDGASVLVLQWTNYRRCGETGGVTFQAHIWENGDLATVIGEIWTDGTSSANRIYAGEEAWIGLEPAGDPAGHVTAQFRKPVVFPGLSVVFQKK